MTEQTNSALEIVGIALVGTGALVGFIREVKDHGWNRISVPAVGTTAIGTLALYAAVVGKFF